MALDTSAIDKRYDLLRNRASAEANAQTQQQQDAIKRRFAAMGGLNTGAFVKQQQNVATAGQSQLQNAREGLDAARSSEVQQAQEVENQRQFARQEREAGQKFQTGEREASQKFAVQQNELQRRYALEDRAAAESFQKSMYAEQYRLEIQPKLAQSARALGLEEDAQKINTRLSIAQSIKQGLPGYTDEDIKAYMTPEQWDRYQSVTATDSAAGMGAISGAVRSTLSPNIGTTLGRSVGNIANKVKSWF